MAMLRATLVRALRSRCAVTRATAAPATRTAPSTAMAALARSNAARTFSSKGVNGVNGLNGLNGDHDDELDDWEDAHGDVSPFERLLQHSQHFRDEVGLEELPERVEDEILGERDEDDHHDELEEEEEEKPTRGEEKKDADNDDLEAVLDEREVDHAEFVGQIRKPHGRHSHSHSHHGESHDHYHSHPDRRHQRDHTRASKRAARWGVEQRVRREIGSAEDVDFEHGLRDLDERRAREKMYVQLLAREYDRDRVCQNCGEPGHVARNCMLPMICSNCGDVGHRRAECPHHSFSIEQLTAVKRTVKQYAAKSGRKKSESQLKAEERRRVELQAIRERHERMKQAFDGEMDEYLDHYERVKKSREDMARKATEEQD